MENSVTNGTIPVEETAPATSGTGEKEVATPGCSAAFVASFCALAARWVLIVAYVALLCSALPQGGNDITKSLI